MTLTMPEAAQAWLQHQATVRAAQDELAPFTVAVGERFTMGGIVWRVCEVRP